MISKIVSNVADAVSGFPYGATVIIGGFGVADQPVELIDALLDQGASDLNGVSMRRPILGSAITHLGRCKSGPGWLALVRPVTGWPDGARP